MSNNISFTGYDARPLKGIFTRDGGFGKSFYSLATQTAEILNKEGVDVFVQTPKKILRNDFSDIKPNFSNFWPWVQDRLAFFPNKTIESKGGFAVSEPYEDASTGDICVKAGIPMKDSNGKVSAVLAMDIDLFKLRLGNDISWVRLTKNEINYKLESDLKDINKNNITIHDYMNIEEQAFNYLEQEFSCNIHKHIRIKSGKNTFECDGLANLEKKDILFEIKYTGNYKLRDAFNRGAQQLLRYSNNINSKKNLELVLVLLADTEIKDKNALQMDLNKEFRRKLITTENSGQVLIIDANDLKTIQHEKSSTVYEHKN